MSVRQERDTEAEEHLWVEGLGCEYHISNLWVSETHRIPSAGTVRDLYFSGETGVGKR